MRSAASSLAILALASASVSLLAGCAGGAAYSGRVVRVTVEDFRIKAPKQIPAGDVEFLVHNKGPDAHEFIVVRAMGALPLRGDGVTADEDAFESHTVGILEPGEPGATRQLRVKLRPGEYELICNMSGHYLGGMRTLIEVT
jgi:uncharacterized cupredoxin-like copper-binding protein